MRFFRFIIVALLLPLIFSFAYEAYLFLISDVDFDLVDWFLYGALSYILLFILILQSSAKLRYLVTLVEHFKHEMAHSLVGFIFLRRTRRIIVNPKDPKAEPKDEETSKVSFFDSSGPDSLISLAPYYLPLFTVPLLLLEPIVICSAVEIIDYLIGFTLTFHFVSVVREFRLIQKDITETGVIFSFFITCILNVIMLVIALCVVSSEYPKILGYLQSSLERTLDSYKTVYQMLRTLDDLTASSNGPPMTWQ